MSLPYAPPTSSSGQPSSSTVFNTTNFQSNLPTIPLTKAVGDTRYLMLAGGQISGLLTTGSLTTGAITAQSLSSSGAVSGLSLSTIGTVSAQSVTFPSNPKTAPTVNQLGYSVASVSKNAATSITTPNAYQEATVNIPYGTYMVYGQVSVTNTGSTAGQISSFLVSISATSTIDSTKQGNLVGISIPAGASVTQNMTAIISNYPSVGTTPVDGYTTTYNLITQLVTTTGSYNTNPTLAILTAVRIA